MWPVVEVKNGEIEDLGYYEVYRNEEDCSNPTISIKEIVMVYARDYEIEYDRSEVPLVVKYDTEFGWHTILFSKVQNLKYVNNGNNWTATFTSVDTDFAPRDDGLGGVDEKQLTKIFHFVLEKAKKRL